MTQPESPRFAVNLDKLAAAVAYLAQRSLHDAAFGETKLVKMLYFADCAAYLRYGRPITGNPYIHLEHGPYPQDWPATKKMLERQGIVTTVKEKLPGDCHRHRLLPTPAADTSALNDQDCFILDAQLRRFANFNAGDIEQYSHAEVAWRTTAPGAVIPYNLAGFRRPTGPPSAETLAHAKRVAERIRERGYEPSRDVTPRF